MREPSFDMLYWVFAHVTADTLRAIAGPFLDRDEAEQQASTVGAYVLGTSVVFLADRTTGGLPPVDF